MKQASPSCGSAESKAPQLTGALCRALAHAIALDDAAVVVDLSEAEPMGLSTLAVIVRAREFLRLWSRSLTVRSPSPSARRLMGICSLKDLLGPEDAVGPGKTLASWVEVPSTLDRRPVRSAPSGPRQRACRPGR